MYKNVIMKLIVLYANWERKLGPLCVCSPCWWMEASLPQGAEFSFATSRMLVAVPRKSLVALVSSFKVLRRNCLFEIFT